jgi:AcrR family transcriptional regulator
MREMKKKTDRRMLRTQKALREALTRLLRRKDYDDITIQDILDEADVGRSTFYSHCSGKDELLRLSLRMLRTEIAGTQRTAREDLGGQAEQPFAFCLPLLLHMTDHRDLYPPLARGCGRELFIGEIRQMVFELAKAELASIPKSDRIPHEVTLQFIVGTFMTLIIWWLDHKSKVAPVALNEMFQQLVQHGIGQAHTAIVPSGALKGRREPFALMVDSAETEKKRGR